MNNQIEEIELLECPMCRCPIAFIEADDPQFYFECKNPKCMTAFNIYAHDLEDAARAMNTRTPSVSYGEAVQKVGIAIIQRDIKGCGGEIMDRGKELAKAALAAMGIEEGK